MELILFNPPNDPVFEQFLQQIRDEGRFFHNGDWKYLPLGVTIKTEYKDSILELKNIRLTKADVSLPIPTDSVYLSIHNWHECFDELIVQGKKANSAEGFLKKYKNFYITGTIPESYWQVLKLYIQDNQLTNIDYQFILAPQAEIESVMVNLAVINATTFDIDRVAKDRENILISHDPDYLSKVLCQRDNNAVIIDVNPHTGFHELISKLTIVQDKNNLSHVDFHLSEMSLLTALKSGRNVILNGELSLSLYHQLLPLLNEPRHLRYNGELLTSKDLATLSLVMPVSAIKNLSLHHYAECHYSDIDYQQLFSHSDRIKVVEIQHFYRLANLLSHRGQGMPPQPSLQYGHLSKLVSALKNPQSLHSHNPIKSLFHYAYPKQSESYAYLNVLAKILFHPEDDFPLREDKLLQIIKKYSLQKMADFPNYCWRILNCFNNKYLAELFPNDNFFREVTAGNLPILPAQVMYKLWEVIIAIQVKQID